jgi:Cu(I)/Ag(I) efflux system membrane fusion protein
MKNILSSKALKYTLFAIGGLFLGWVLFHSPERKEEKPGQPAETSITAIWTCAMHPQIRMSEPGKCPICGMELIPLNQNGNQVDSVAIHFTPEAVALANIQTVVVSRQDPVKEVRLYGKIQADERLLQSQVAHITGRIDKLLVNFTGEAVIKGQTIAVIYSPELITAQQELLEALQTKETQAEIYEAAKERLRQKKLTDFQISNIERTGNVQNSFELISNTTGIVTAKRVNVGDYISQGTVLYDIADLSSVWALFDAYESDLPFLSKGDMLTFTLQALPGKSFEGKVVFIDPVIDPLTRVARVRAEIKNQSGTLKPEMFAIGIISARLEEYQNNMVIPRSAVLWTGKRSVVYVKSANSQESNFKIREIEIGPMLGNSYVVINGLNEGEEIVSQGSFSVDAAAQLEGKPSMMNPPVKAESMTGMVMSDEDSSMLKHASISVSGNCEMCKERIETAAKSVNGVSAANWDLKTKMLHLDFSAQTNIDDVHRAIIKEGHDTEKMKAEVEVYNKLPECCLYRK